jgi:hypothetical protein
VKATPSFAIFSSNSKSFFFFFEIMEEEITWGVGFRDLIVMIMRRQGLAICFVFFFIIIMQRLK